MGVSPCGHVVRGGDLAKRTSRKQSPVRKARKAVTKRPSRRAPTPAKRSTRSVKATGRAKPAKAKRTGTRQTQQSGSTSPHIARKKNAARAASTRATRREAKPPEPGRL